MGNSVSLHNKRKLRNRKALKSKSYGKLRLTVFRSSRHIYGQIIDDVKGITITSASSLESNIKKQFKNCGTKEVATLVGKLIAEKAIKIGIKNVIITLGEKGIYFANEKENFFLEAYKLKKPVIDTTGAGDAFNGAFAVGLANDLDIKEALSFANKVAGISTTRLGAASSMPFAKELTDN